ncbi:MAG: hypothetical protein WA615_15485 [Bradyrhizobium sp.]|uniref:hypothetical protein n=1 Tax=Bradyrhizobium sp. TaxID=376 RepID=UPI003C7A27A1
MARRLCDLKSIFGQLYPARLLARLVTLELASKRQPSSSSCPFARQKAEMDLAQPDRAGVYRGSA